LTSEPKTSSSHVLASLSDITNKISESLKQNATAEQLNFLANEHRRVMEKLKKYAPTELKDNKPYLKNVYDQIQSVQKEMGVYHHTIKEKLLSFNKKRKQLNAYNASY